MKRNWCMCIIGFIVLILLLSLPLFAFREKGGKTNLDALAYTAPELRVVETPEDFSMIKEGFATRDGVGKFLLENGAVWTAMVDLRRGVPTLLDGGALPIIPGPANSLSWNSFGADCASIQCIPKEKIETLAREFLDRYPGLFPVRQDELVMDPDGTMALGESIYLVRFQWVVNGIPVEGASIYFRINNGNLIQVASTRIAPVSVDTSPAFTQETAWQILNGYLGDEGVNEKDIIVERGRLVLIPATPKGFDPNVYSGAIGSMSDMRLAFQLVFSRPGLTGTWEAMIDAHSGEILRFVDKNRYGKVHGTVYPSEGHTGGGDRPFPFAHTDLAAPNDYADVGGNFTGSTATVDLAAGRYTWINDSCGPTTLPGTTGDFDYGESVDSDSSGNVIDCDVPVPNPAGAGNTWAGKTLYYHVTMINIKARTYMPTNDWLNNNHMNINVNQSAWCNATSGSGTINFYQSTLPSCWNLGELPGVALHEWAHSMDDFDGSGGDSPPVETRADWSATLQTHDSCCGRGALYTTYPTPSNCDGYGDACTSCNGIRDSNRLNHADTSPWTAANGAGDVYDCGGSGSYNGPCNWEDHCESGISTQALWEFVTTDLPTECGVDVTTAWMIEDRLWYMAMPTISSMYNCTPPTSDGCGGSTLYTVMRAIDDDGDGTANGTPHAHAIYHALARHNIACGADGDALNQNQTSCPSLSTPVLTATAGSNQVHLSWTTGGVNATRYFVFRNDTNCDAGFTKIAIVDSPTLTYDDNTASNNLTSYYRVQAATANDSCTSAMSNCEDATPQPCTASVILGQSLYACSSTVNVTMLDSTPGASPWTGYAWSTSDATQRAFTLTGSTPDFTGSFTTTTGAGGPGVVHVANGDTLTVRFTDPDNCGAGSYNADTTALIDCVGPVISNVSASVAGITATITWDTNELSDSRIYYSAGTAGPPWTEAYSSALTTSHSIQIPGLPTCTRFYFYVESTDGAGNTAYDNNGGSYYIFVTGLLVNLVDDDFEGSWGPYGDNPPAGWTIEDHGSVPGTWDTNDWYNYAKGGSYGAVARVNYSPVENQDEWLITPAFAIENNLTSIDLEFDHFFNWYHAGDYGYVDYTSDQHAGWTTLATYSADTADMAHEALSLLSYLGDTNARIRFRYVGNDGLAWEVDNVLVRGTGACASSMGSVSLDAATYICSGDTITVTIRDTDLSGSAQATVTTTGGDSETVTCSETGLGVFTGTISTAILPVSIGNGLVNVGDGETITAAYHDENDGTGNPADVYDTAVTDCAGPVITDILITNVTPTTATVTWTTSEPANSRVTYGTSTPPGTNADDLTSYVTSHTMVLSGLSICTTYYLSVTSADMYANSVTDTNGGSYYTFTTQGMSYDFGPFGAESGTDGWTLTGEWHQDTCKVHSGTYAMKAGSTTCPGTYAISTTSDMTWSSDINMGSAGHGYHLRYWEYYETESCCDDLRPQISTNGGTTWTNLTEYAGTGTAWVQRDIDLAAYTGNIRLRFEMYSDGSLYYEGWYLDDIEISKSQTCDALLEYQSNTYTDHCAAGGTGDGDGLIDAGEDVTLQLTLYNDGGSGATGVTGLLSTSTSGVTVTDATASFPDIAANGTGVSISNHFAFHVGSSVACGTVLDFTIHMVSNEGNWDDTFTLTVGEVVPGGGTLVTENFEGSWGPYGDNPSAGWTIEDHGSVPGTWDTNDWYNFAKGGTYGAVARVYYYPLENQDEWLISPMFNIPSSSTAVDLEYDHYFYEYSAEDAYVDFRSDQTPSWTELAHYSATTGTSDTYAHATHSLLSHVGETNCQVRFRYVGYNGWYWEVDNVEVSYAAPGGCNMNACSGGCTDPTEPVLSSVVDNDPEVQDGVTVTFTAGSPSTSNSLIVDTVEVATGITSPYVYNPGNTASHSYVVRTYNTPSCLTDSDPVNCTDEEETAVIPGEVASGTNFTWSGQTMGWTADSNATGYRVYRGLLSNLSALCDATNDFCLRNDGASTSLDVTGDDPSGQSGRCFYYLITGYSGAGEGPAGTATCGARIVNSSGGCL